MVSLSTDGYCLDKRLLEQAWDGVKNCACIFPFAPLNPRYYQTRTARYSTTSFFALVAKNHDVTFHVELWKLSVVEFPNTVTLFFKLGSCLFILILKASRVNYFYDFYLKSFFFGIRQECT